MENFVILLQSTVNPKCKISFHQNLHQKCLTTNTKQQNLKFEQTKVNTCTMLSSDSDWFWTDMASFRRGWESCLLGDRPWTFEPYFNLGLPGDGCRFSWTSCGEFIGVFSSSISLWPVGFLFSDVFTSGTLPRSSDVSPTSNFTFTSSSLAMFAHSRPVR